MGKVPYISIWKDESLWKTVAEIVCFISGGFYLINDLFEIGWGFIPFTIALGMMVIAQIPDTIIANTSKPVDIIKRMVFWRTLFYIILATVIITVTYYFPDKKGIATFILGCYIIISCIFSLLYKEEIMASQGTIYLLFNDTPAVFSKKFFQESSKGKMIGTSIFYLLVFAYVVFYVIAITRGWELNSLI